MHGVRVELLEAQAERIGLPLLKIQIPEMPSMEVYANTMEAALLDLKEKGVTASCLMPPSFLNPLNLKKVRWFIENILHLNQTTTQRMKALSIMDFGIVIWWCLTSEYSPL